LKKTKMIHLTPADYTRQPWKNGLGTTTELWRLERDGKLLVRISQASVVQDGPFSLFPGIERNLTVISGPGFRLTGGGIDLRCGLLQPVAFPGDVAVIATETNGQPSDDFNLMTAQGLPLPKVTLARNETLGAGGTLALFALEACTANSRDLNPNDLVLTDGPVTLTGDGQVIAVRLLGL
jgi:environmental stress-induced protein Ves